MNSTNNIADTHIKSTLQRVREHFIVTGASGSLGVEIVKSLLRKDFSVVMACRNLQKGETVRQAILLEFPGKENQLLLEELDLASFASIRRFAQNISKLNIRLIGLMNNAGTLNRQFSLTPEGFENTIGVNYIGVFFLTKLIISLLEEGAGITNVVSMTSNPKRIDLDFFKLSAVNFRQLGSYGKSKTALMLLTSSLAEKYAGKFTVNAADPGIVDTNIITLGRWFDPLADVLFRPLIKSPQKGAIPLVNALLADVSGKLFLGSKFKRIPKGYTQHPLKEWLWQETERYIAKFDTYSPSN